LVSKGAVPDARSVTVASDTTPSASRTVPESEGCCAALWTEKPSNNIPNIAQRRRRPAVSVARSEADTLPRLKIIAIFPQSLRIFRGRTSTASFTG
jgi:hypothetical protein